MENHEIKGISCKVSTCKHHGTGNTCQATKISVGTEYAESKAETFCSTFENKLY